MNHQRYTQAPMKIVGLFRTYTGPDEGFAKLWQGFLPRVSEIQNRVEGTMYGVQIPGGGGDKNTHGYYCGIEVKSFDQIPEGMKTVEVPGHKYIKFTHEGSLETLCETIDYVFSRGQDEAEVSFADGPQLEIYGKEFDPHSDDSIMYFAVPIE